MKGETTVVGAVADAATGRVLGLEVLVERDSDGFMEWLGDFAREYGVEAMVADDISAYKPAVERLGIDHQICAAHARKRARNRFDRIDRRDWVNARIRRRLTELPFDVDLELPRLERAVRDGDATLRRLCVDLSEKWRAPLRRQRGGHPMDEQRGGARDKIRRKTVMGYKSEDGILNGFGLRRWAWSGWDGLEPVAA